MSESDTWEPQEIRGWLPTDEASDLATEIFLNDLPSLPIEPLSSRLTSDLRSEENSEQRDFYADAIHDFARLIDEVRFETSVAAAFISSLKEILFKEVDEEDLSRTVGVPREVLALLAPYVAQNWLPTDLFSRPEMEISGSRILGGWFAGQLLDSALIRSISALDRIAILLWCAAPLPIERDRFGELRLPAFRKGYLNRMAPHYSSRAEWTPLANLVDHDFMGLVKPYRDGFVHRRRTPMQLHGEHVTVVDLHTDNPRKIPGFDPNHHLGMVLGFYDTVLKPATELAGALVTAPNSGRYS